MKLRIVGFLLVAVPEPPEDDAVELEADEAVELDPDVPLVLDLLVLEPVELVPALAVAEEELLVVVGVVLVVVWEEVDWLPPADEPDPLVVPFALLPPTRPIRAST